MAETLFVFAQIRPKPEYFANAKAAISEILNDTRQETGCLSFLLLEGRGDGCLYLQEEWQDQAALDAHYAEPYVAEVFQKYESWLAEEPHIHKMSRVA